MTKRRDWPDDHPNTRVLMLVDSSRTLIERLEIVHQIPPSPIAVRVLGYCDEIERLIESMWSAKTHAEVQALVAQVTVLMNQVIPMMEIVRKTLEDAGRAAKK